MKCIFSSYFTMFLLNIIIFNSIQAAHLQSPVSTEHQLPNWDRRTSSPFQWTSSRLPSLVPADINQEESRRESTASTTLNSSPSKSGKSVAATKAVAEAAKAAQDYAQRCSIALTTPMQISTRELEDSARRVSLPPQRGSALQRIATVSSRSSIPSSDTDLLSIQTTESQIFTSPIATRPGMPQELDPYQLQAETSYPVTVYAQGLPEQTPIELHATEEIQIRPTTPESYLQTLLKKHNVPKLTQRDIVLITSTALTTATLTSTALLLLKKKELAKIASEDVSSEMLSSLNLTSKRFYIPGSEQVAGLAISTIAKGTASVVFGLFAVYKTKQFFNAVNDFIHFDCKKKESKLKNQLKTQDQDFSQKSDELRIQVIALEKALQDLEAKTDRQAEGIDHNFDTLNRENAEQAEAIEQCLVNLVTQNNHLQQQLNEHADAINRANDSSQRGQLKITEALTEMLKVLEDFESEIGTNQAQALHNTISQATAAVESAKTEVHTNVKQTPHLKDEVLPLPQTVLQPLAASKIDHPQSPMRIAEPKTKVGCCSGC